MLPPLLCCLTLLGCQTYHLDPPGAHNPTYPWKPPPEFYLSPQAKLSVGCCPHSSQVPRATYPFLWRPVTFFPSALLPGL